MIGDILKISFHGFVCLEKLFYKYRKAIEFEQENLCSGDIGSLTVFAGIIGKYYDEKNYGELIKL